MTGRCSNRYLCIVDVGNGATPQPACGQNQRRLYEFDGVVAKMNGETQRLEASSLILRGCTLKNTEWVLGMVLFAGVDTRIFRNRAAVPRKVGAGAGYCACVQAQLIAQFDQATCSHVTLSSL